MPTNSGFDRSDAHTMCWVPWKAYAVDRMPCTGVLMPYRANKQNTIRRVLIAQNRKHMNSYLKFVTPTYDLVCPQALHNNAV